MNINLPISLRTIINHPTDHKPQITTQQFLKHTISLTFLYYFLITVHYFLLLYLTNLNIKVFLVPTKYLFYREVHEPIQDRSPRKVDSCLKFFTTSSDAIELHGSFPLLHKCHAIYEFKFSFYFHLSLY